MSNFDRYTTARPAVAVGRSAAVDLGLRAYMLGVYNYMAIGLVITGVVAFGAFRLGTVDVGSGHIALNSLGQALYVSPLRWVFALAPLGVVFYLSARMQSMSVASARNAFFVFSALIGLSMSAIFVIYTAGSIGRVFFETAAAFGALSLYGYTTKRDLTAIGSFLVMGLFGLVIASVVNVFLGSNSLQWTLSVLAIGIFAGLTAWNTQSIKAQYYAGYGAEALQKAAIFGALQLYLAFINMFQALLSLTGSQRSN